MFSFLTFLRCFHFSPFSGIFIFHLSQVFHFSFFSGVFALLYRECYTFERALFTLRCFLPYAPSPHLPQYRKYYRFQTNFLLSGFFYLSLLPDIWNNLLWSRLLWKSTFLPWRLQGLPLRFKTQTRPICLLESHSVQQKGLVGRFYLCVEAPQYQSLPGFNPLFNRYVYCKAHVISTKPQKFLMIADL